MQIHLQDPSVVSRLSKPSTLHVYALGQEITLKKALEIAGVKFEVEPDKKTAIISAEYT